jgi:hypothetical protein
MTQILEHFARFNENSRFRPISGISTNFERFRAFSANFDQNQPNLAKIEDFTPKNRQKPKNLNEVSPKTEQFLPIKPRISQERKKSYYLK